MVMKRATVGFTAVLACLLLWAAPVDAANRVAPKRVTSAKKDPAAKKDPSAKKAGATKKGGARKLAVPVKGTVAEPETVPAVLVEQPAAAPEAEQQAAVPAVPEVERPWAKGVPKERQTEALELFRVGNGLLKESIFVEAATQYRKALALWDHPAIHYNLALALLNLDQPLEVHEHLLSAMRFGAAPLDTEKYEHARSYLLLVEKQLARVEITCQEPGAAVVMDGRPLFTAPGRYEGMVRAGPHTIVATKEGYLTSDMSRALPPGEKSTIDLKLFSSEDLTEYRRRWSAWKPWVVVGAGVALAAGGGLLHLQARDSFRQFDLGVEACGGCVPDTGLADTRVRGDTMQTLAIGGYAVGGAALVTGAVLVYMNRLQPYRVNPVDTAKSEQPVSIMPLLGGESKGVQATFRF
jgi:hypothetical protein